MGPACPRCVPQEQIDALHTWQTSDCFDEQERAVFQFSEEQAVELGIIIGYYGMIIRILETFQIELEAD